MKTFHINLLRQYVERDNVEMTATQERRYFPGKKTRVETGIEVQGVQGRQTPGGSSQWDSKIVVGASADYVKEQKDVNVDDKKLLDIGVLRPKENIRDVCPGVELTREQQKKIMEVLGKREKTFTDISGKTSIIEHWVHLVDDCRIRCRPYALPYAVRGEIQKEKCATIYEENLEKIRQAKRPTTKKEVQSFLGLANYYHDHILSFAAIAEPLSDLTRKGLPERARWDELQE